MSLEVAIGLVLIVAFVVTIFKRWFSPYAALVFVPLVCGLVYCAMSGQSLLTVFDWIYNGVFYAVNEEGGVTPGTTRSALMVLFACTYFTIMMNVGLFEPLITGTIRLVKGDPLKIVVASTLVAAAVSLDGDGTSTVLITTAAFMPLYKQFGIKGAYLALLIALPTSVFNMTPWGGPLARCLSGLNLDVSQLFPKLLPGMAVVMVYDVFLAYMIGRKERARLGYSPKNASSIPQEKIEAMVQAVKDNNAELKRPKLALYNLIVTLVIMYMLVTGMANSALLFMAGIAAALFVNYGFNFKTQKDRLTEALAEGMPACSMIIASGFFMGILNGSGMTTGIAGFLGQIVPASSSNLLPLFAAVVGIPGLIFLGPDAYYFGVLPVLATLAAEYGISAVTMGVAGMMPLATFYATPLTAWLFILCERCEVEFGDYQKQFLKISFPAFLIYAVVFALTGSLPLF